MNERERLVADLERLQKKLEDKRAKLVPLKEAVLEAKARLDAFDARPGPDLQPGDAIAHGQVVEVSMKAGF